MRAGFLMMVLGLGVLWTVTARTPAAEVQAPPRKLELSPELLALLRAEMLEVARGMQGITLALATGDWKSVAATSAQVHASYIMEKKLTSELATELERALPQRFKQLDAEFHQRAVKLEAAATAGDAELVAFHYSRMVESCVTCHSEFAASRFPGFSAGAPQGQHH